MPSRSPLPRRDMAASSGRRRRAAAAAAAATALCAVGGALAASTTSQAAVYRAYTCSTPDGAPASTAAWRAYDDAPSGGGHSDDCETGGALRTWLDRDATHGQNEVNAWAWHTPDGGLRAVGGALNYWVQRAGDADGVGRIRASHTGATLLECGAASGCLTAGFPGRDGSPLLIDAAEMGTISGEQVRVQAACGVSYPSFCTPVPAGVSESDAPTKVEAAVYGGYMLIADDEAPTVSIPGGNLITDVYLRSPYYLSLGAKFHDAGSGARQLFLQREISGSWTTLAVTDIGDRESCQPVDQDRGIPSYTHPVPCTRSIYASVGVAASSVPEGRHQFRAFVEDAAGNRTTFLGPVERIIDWTPPTIDYATTPGSCTEGETVSVRPTVTDAVAGIDTVVVSVLDKDGIALGVTANGTIECPAVDRGPLTISTTAIDLAGNEATVSGPAPMTVLVKPDPPKEDPPKEDPPDKTPVGGGGDNPDDGGDLTPDGGGFTPDLRLDLDLVPVIDQQLEGARRLLACSARDVTLIEAVPTGRRDIVSGVASPDLFGQTVSILYGPKRRVVARLPVAADGTFRSAVAAPKKGGTTNSARYTARIGNSVSSALKRARRMYSTRIYKAVGSSIRVEGRLTRPYRPGTRVRIQQRGAQCGAWSTLTTTKVDAAGRYSVTVPVTSPDASLVVRAVSEVQAAGRTGKKKRRTFRTQTLPGLVAMR